MEVMDVTQIMDGWLNQGPRSLSTEEDCGWPSRVADMVLVIKGSLEPKVSTTAHQPSPRPSDSSGSLT